MNELGRRVSAVSELSRWKSEKAHNHGSCNKSNLGCCNLFDWNSFLGHRPIRFECSNGTANQYAYWPLHRPDNVVFGLRNGRGRCWRACHRVPTAIQTIAQGKIGCSSWRSNKGDNDESRSRPDNHPSTNVDRRDSDLATQQELGLLPKRWYRSNSHHHRRATPPGTNLGKSTHRRGDSQRPQVRFLQKGPELTRTDTVWAIFR